MTTVAISDLRHALAYLKPVDVGRVEQAYEFSDAAHHGQMRQSGDPYISHPLAVAEIVAHWQLDAQAVRRGKQLEPPELAAAKGATKADSDPNKGSSQKPKQKAKKQKAAEAS